MKAIAFFLVLIFAAGAFVQLGSSEQPEPIKPIPGTGLHSGPGISDSTLIVRQGTEAHFWIKWWTYRKEQLRPLENYTVEIEFITNGKGERIPLPEGMNITHRARRSTKEKLPYETYIDVYINTSVDTPAGVYILYLTSKECGIRKYPVTLVVIDKENIRAGISH